MFPLLFRRGVLVSCVAIGFVCAHASAQGVFSVNNIAGDASILNSGTLVIANNLGTGPTSATVNGVNFGTSASGLSGLAGGGGDFWVPTATTSPTTGNTSADMNNLLSTTTYTNLGTTGSLTINGLTAGQDYRLQLLVADSQFGARNQRFNIDFLNVNVATTTGPASIAKNVVYEFTATSPTLTVTAKDIAGDAILNAYSLHQIASAAASPLTIQSLTSPSQLNGSGIIIAAENAGDTAGDFTVAATGGNILFQGDDPNLSFTGVTDGMLASGVADANLAGVLNDLYFNNGGTIGATVNGLTAGETYLAQVLLNVTTQAGRDVDLTFEGETFNIVETGNQLVSYQWVATDAVFNFAMTSNPGNVVLSGLVVSQLSSVPEPASLAIWGLLLSAAVLIGWWRRGARP